MFHHLTILPLPQWQQVGGRLQGQLLKLTGHCLALWAGGGAWRRPGDYHAAGTLLLPLLWVQRWVQGDGETCSASNNMDESKWNVSYKFYDHKTVFASWDK